MIAFLLLNWRWLVPTAAAAALGLMLGGSRLEVANLKQARAEERRQAAQLQADALDRALKAERKSAELTSQLDAQHAQYLAAADATRSDFERRLADRLRTRRSACGNGVPGQAADPGVPAASSAGSDNGPRGADFDAGRQLREAVKKLQATVLTCVAWAQQEGR